MPLFPCSACHRHVRELECPFCGAPVVRDSAPRTVPAGLTRAALVLGAALSVSACEDPAPEPAYGGPPVDAGPADAWVAPDAAYGAPPLDAGPAPEPAYGGPPVDAGPAPDAAYGGPPLDAGPAPEPAYGGPPVDGGAE